MDKIEQLTTKTSTNINRNNNFAGKKNIFKNQSTKISSQTSILLMWSIHFRRLSLTLHFYKQWLILLSGITAGAHTMIRLSWCTCAFGVFVVLILLLSTFNFPLSPSLRFKQLKIASHTHVYKWKISTIVLYFGARWSDFRFCWTR